MEEVVNKEKILMKEKKIIVRFTSTEEMDFDTAVQQVIKHHSVILHKE